MTNPRILVAGIGNIFLGDDAFGSEVARRLVAKRLPDDVRVVDFGIRGFDLTYALLEDHELTILVDATPQGKDPGTLFVIEPELDDLAGLSQEEMMIETHGMNPLKVLAMAKSMGAKFQRLLLVGCEPSPLDPASDGQMGLSQPVESSVDVAVEMIESLIAEAGTKQTSATA